MKIKIQLITGALLAVLLTEASSQTSQVTYFMKIPQNHFLNPAIKPSDRFYVGLPIITGISAGFGNNFLQLSDIFPPGDTIDDAFFQNLNLNKLAGKLKNPNTITADASIQLLGLGLSVGKDLFLFFDVVDKLNVKMVLPSDLMKLYVTGPEQFLGQTIDLSGMNIKGQFFREYGLGFSRNITGNLRIGAKVKLLSGLASLSLDSRSFSLKINADTSQSVTADVSMDVSGKESLQKMKDHFSGSGFNDYLHGALDYLKTPVSNSGVSFDFGAVYNLGKLFTFSASLTDLGFINWKKDLKSYNANNSFNLPGITLQDVVDTTFSIKDMVNRLVDTVKANFIENPSPQSFKTYLPAGISVGASVNLLNVFSLGILSNTKIYARTVKESVTLSGNAYIGRTLSASMSYTMANYSYNNLGFGLSFKTGAVAQFYFIADKIPLSWGKIHVSKSGGGSYSTFPIPQSLNMLNLQLGLNIAFGKPVIKKIDKPMVVVEQD